MNALKWSLLGCQLLATLTTASPIRSPTPATVSSGPPTVTRNAIGAGPSQYPYGKPYENEMRYENWDPTDADEAIDGIKIHETWEPMLLMAELAWHEADQRTATFRRWFDVGDADKVKSVFERILHPDQNTLKAAELLSDIVVDRSDFHNNDCQSSPFPNAYTLATTGRMHFCTRAFTQPYMEELECSDLDGSAESGYYSSYKISTIAGTLLHEITHWNAIGEAALGQRIIDHPEFGGGEALGCHQLLGPIQLINAQNYAFLGSEAYLQNKGCNFVDPPSSNAADRPYNSLVISKESDIRAISIIRRSSIRGTFAENDWYVYDTPMGVSALCRPAEETVAKWAADDGPAPSAMSTAPQWPNGVFRVEVWGQECEYKNDGTNAGALWCLGRKTPYKCFKDEKLDKKEGKMCRDNIYQQPYVYCQPF